MSTSGTSAGEVFPVPMPLENPPERASTSLNQRTFSQLCIQFGIPEADALFSEKDQFADSPPHGFVAVNRQMCSHGAIPPFNPFLETILRHLAIAPSQLHPNGYAILLGLCVLSMRTLERLLTFEEVCYLCTFSKVKVHPSIIQVKSARGRKLIEDLPESAHGFLNQYFYVRCPGSFYAIWTEGVTPPPFKGSDFKSTLDKLKGVAKEERGAKFLLKNEFLHQYGLLDPSRSVVPRAALSAPSPKVEVPTAPALSEELAPHEPAKKASLKRCSVHFDGGSESTTKAQLATINEEEEPSQRSGNDRSSLQGLGQGNDEISAVANKRLCIGQIDDAKLDKMKSALQTETETETPALSKLPFAKTSPCWAAMESSEVFLSMPQQPHFLPLKKYVETEREGQAILLMVNFSTVVNNILNFSISDTDECIEEMMESLHDFERHGFSLYNLREMLCSFQSLKEEHCRVMDELNATNESKSNAQSENDMLNEKIEAARKSIMELALMEKTLSDKRSLTQSRLEGYDCEIIRLQNMKKALEKSFQAAKRSPDCARGIVD